MEKEVREKKNKKYKGKPKWYGSRQGKGRCSKAQKLAYKEVFPSISINKKYGEVINFREEFQIPDNYPDVCILDVGFGMGDSLIHTARMYKEKYVLGCEIHRPGLANACLKVQDLQLKNVRLYGGDAFKLLNRHIAEGCQAFEQIHVFFPDPWKQDIDRRIIRPETINLFLKYMVHCADLFIATDISDYVDYIEKTMQPFIDSGLFRGGRCDRVNFRPVTKYEQIAIDEGREVVDFHYIYNDMDTTGDKQGDTTTTTQ